MLARTPKTISSFMISLGVVFKVSARSRIGMFSLIFTSSNACSSSTGSGLGSGEGSSITAGFLIFGSVALGFSFAETFGFSNFGDFSSCLTIFKPSFFPVFASIVLLLSCF